MTPEDILYCQLYLERILSLALENRYTRWYIALCRKAAIRCQERSKAKELLGYIESHHILPRSFKLGGDNSRSNQVHFSAREHFVSHLLLAKMFSREDRYYAPMIKAFQGMSESV